MQVYLSSISPIFVGLSYRYSDNNWYFLSYSPFIFFNIIEECKRETISDNSLFMFTIQFIYFFLISISKPCCQLFYSLIFL